MKPIANAVPGSPEAHYTQLHAQCRNVIERCIGVLKARWRCLLVDRTLHYDPVKAGRIINACVVLHNYLTQLRAPVPVPVLEDLGVDAEDIFGDDLPLLHQAEAVRRLLVNYAHERWLHLHGQG